MRTQESKSTKEIGKEIKTLQQIKGVKLSVICDYNHISVSLMEAPFEVYVEGYENEGRGVNHYSFMENKNLTKEAKLVFQMVDEIIKKYHWDESDSMTDYFHCAFYYSYGIGKWDKPFINNYLCNMLHMSK